MGRIVEGFVFSDYCMKCQKVSEHKVVFEGGFFGVCSSCGLERVMSDVKQVYYPKTELWVTRFKIGNLPSVVAGKLLEAAKDIKS
jgi:hypothetical protein